MDISKLAQATLVSAGGDAATPIAEAFQKEYARLQEVNLIIDLSGVDGLKPAAIREFEALSERHRAAGKSFVIVTPALSYEDVPEELVVVPSVQEACDLIEMEEIERDLDRI